MFSTHSILLGMSKKGPIAGGLIAVAGQMVIAVVD